MQNVSAMHNSRSSHSKSASSRGKSSSHSKKSQSRVRTRDYNNKAVTLPLSGKKALKLKKQLNLANIQENKISKLQEKNDKLLSNLAKKLNTIPDNKLESQNYRKLASRYIKTLHKKEQLYIKDSKAYKKFVDLNREYHSGLSGNYHIKARALNNKITTLIHKRDALHESHKHMPWDVNRHTLYHEGHSKEYGTLSDKIDKMEEMKQKLTWASETHHKLSEMPTAQSTWRQLLQK